MIARKSRSLTVALGVAVILAFVWFSPTSFQRSCAPPPTQTALQVARATNPHFFAPCSGFYCGKKFPQVVPLRLAKINQADVEFVMAVEPNPGDLLSDHLLLHGSWEVDDARLLLSLLKEKLSKQSTCLFLDVGANQGIHSIYMAKLGCRVIAFEMQQRIAALMQISLMLNSVDDQVTLINKPVYDSPKDLFYIPVATNLGGTGIFEGSRGDPSEIKLSSVRIDDVVKERIDIMKLDVEGSEYHALKSMSRLFEQNMVGEIIMETWGVSEAQVYLLYDLGYMPHRQNNIGVPIRREDMANILTELKGKGIYEDFLFRKVAA